MTCKNRPKYFILNKLHEFRGFTWIILNLYNYRNSIRFSKCRFQVYNRQILILIRDISITNARDYTRMRKEDINMMVEAGPVSWQWGHCISVENMLLFFFKSHGVFWKGCSQFITVLVYLYKESKVLSIRSGTFMHCSSKVYHHYNTHARLTIPAISVRKDG